MISTQICLLQAKSFLIDLYVFILLDYIYVVLLKYLSLIQVSEKNKTFLYYLLLLVVCFIFKDINYNIDQFTALFLQ